MGYLARKPQTLAGVEYRAGDVLPADAVEHPGGLGATRMEGLGLLRVVPDEVAAGADVTAELEEVRADRNHVKTLLAEATDRIVELERQLAEALEAATAPDEASTPDTPPNPAEPATGEPGPASGEPGELTPITKPVDPTAPAPAPEPPPQGGAGSGRPEWLAYAASVGVTVPDGAPREDIIDAIEAAGLPT